MASPADHPLVQLRAVAGVTQEALAASSGVARSTIAAIEAGSTNPSRRTVRRLALAFGVDADALASALVRSSGVETLLASVTWHPNASTQDEPPPMANDSVIRSAASVLRMITLASRRNRATLDELDIVRNWVNSLGPVDAIADCLQGHEPEDVQLLFDLMFREARTDPTLTGGTALMSIALQFLERVLWSDNPLDPPYTFMVRTPSP